jgi:glutamate synthase (NADPH) small chain
METYQDIRLIMEAEVWELMEKRRLKEDDLRRTIAHAENTDEKFVHPETGHFLEGARPYFVTVWVEYQPREDGYLVFSAYQHRVKITGGPTP